MLKIVKRGFIVLILFLFFIFIFSQGHVPKKDELRYGVTFSKKQANDLGLEWHEVFNAMINDLGVKKIRLAAYWDELEKEFDAKYDWEDLDWQINKASQEGVEIILAMGARLPRWPECHYPDWTNEINKRDREDFTLDYLEKVVLRYRDNKNIVAWQVENEPFLKYFGVCPELDKDFLDKEIALVKKLDERPAVITDSGELSVWIPAASRADIFGTTMYRDTYSEALKKYIHYPITPGFFRLKKNIVRFFAHPDKWIVIEMQGEPWGPEPFQNLSKEERDKTMNLEKFRDIVEFSSQTGFSEFYLWGVEWWYWEKKTQNDPAIWNEAVKLFN